MISIFKTGLIDYDDHGLDKPIKYTDEDLKLIAASTSKVDVTDEHTKKVLSHAANFIYKDGQLWVEDLEDLDYKSKGLSPEFLMNLVDRGEYYKPQDIQLKKLGLTPKPRSHVIYNSIIDKKEDKKEGENMGDDEVYKKAVETLNDKQEEIGRLKAQIKSSDKSLKEKKQLEDDLKEAKKKLKETNEELDKLKDKAANYDKHVKDKKDVLIKELVGEDEELAKEFEDFSYEKLKILKEKKIINQEPRGVGNNGAPGEDGDGTGGDNTPDGDDFLKWRKKQKRW